jgi:HAD superfamily phosphoserine phosphatase-like hydrolase
LLWSVAVSGTSDQGSAAFVRLEGALSPVPASSGAMVLAASMPSMRRRIFGVAGVALGAALGRRDPSLTRELAWSVLRGTSEDRIAVLGEDFARDTILPSIKPHARRLLEEARAAGRRVVIIAETIDAIARPVADALGIERVIANALVFDRGYATGELREPIVGAEIDPRRVRELAASEGLDLARSCAYGGRRGDGVLLSLVGLPCAIDPDRELARVARDLDWPVVRDRDGEAPR